MWTDINGAPHPHPQPGVCEGAKSFYTACMCKEIMAWGLERGLNSLPCMGVWELYEI